MKRSEINSLMSEALAFIGEHGFALPPFVRWTPEDWKTKGEEYGELRKNMLGWDITDFGSGDFNKIGLLLITLRNGSLERPDDKTYAEKLMIVSDGQVTPYHFHWKKMEDIINRGGGNLVIKCYNSGENGEKLDTPVEVRSDGRRYTVPAGERIVLEPGQSMTMTTGLYHTFWAENGMTLVGEVSKVNDDHTDNRFYDEVGRFPTIEEDVPALYPLFSEV